MKIISIIILILGILFIGTAIDSIVSEAKLGADVCPVCDCKITAKKIISDNPTIDLSQYSDVIKYKLSDNPNIEIQIGKDIYTKQDLDAAKLSR